MVKTNDFIYHMIWYLLPNHKDFTNLKHDLNGSHERPTDNRDAYKSKTLQIMNSRKIQKQKIKVAKQFLPGDL